MSEDDGAGEPAEEAGEVDPALAAVRRAQAAAASRGLRRGAPGRGPGRRSFRPGPGLGHAGSGPGASPRDPQLVGPVLNRLVAERGWSAPVSIGGVVGRWEQIVGAQLAERCEIETFDDAVLVVRADSTAWATQLRLLLPQLERRIAEEVGEGVVEKIVVRGPGGPSWAHGPRHVRGRGPRDTYG
ncbi:MAG TPA: DciA family protein [Actinomycetaceae bacterium]|nr:DciA family protein [Actinomycetaceae bacterium]